MCISKKFKVNKLALWNICNKNGKRFRNIPQKGTSGVKSVLWPISYSRGSAFLNPLQSGPKYTATVTEHTPCYGMMTQFIYTLQEHVFCICTTAGITHAYRGWAYCYGFSQFVCLLRSTHPLTTLTQLQQSKTFQAKLGTWAEVQDTSRSEHSMRTLAN